MLRQFCVAVTILLFTAACSASERELESEEKTLLTELAFDFQLVAKISSDTQSISRLVGTNEDFEEVPASGIILQTKPSDGRRVLANARRVLKETDYVAFLNDENFGFGPDKVVVLKSADAYDYFAIVRTNGINYDLDHPSVLARYRSWDQKYGLKLVGAGFDWLEAEFVGAPDNWEVFAGEVYEFCPDVVDQGAGDVEALAQEMKRTDTVYLWWD